MRAAVVYHGGATPATRALYEAVAARVDALDVVVPVEVGTEATYAPGPLTAAREAGAYRVVPVPLHDPNAYWLGYRPRPLLRALARARPRVVQVLDEPLSATVRQAVRAGALAAPRARILFYGFENVPPPRPRLRRRLLLHRLAAGAASSDGAIEAARAAGVPERVRIERVFWGVDTAPFERAAAERTPRHALGLPDGPLVGFVGRLVPEKGLRVLLEALRLLPADTRLLVVGAGPLAAELERCATLPAFAGRVLVREPLDPELLARRVAAMDVLALPSLTTPRWREQYGRVLGEAMAAGVPVVGSDSGAIPEVVADAGLIVPEDDAPALAEALGSVLADAGLRARLAAAGRVRAREELGVDAMADRLVALWREVA